MNNISIRALALLNAPSHLLACGRAYAHISKASKQSLAAMPFGDRVLVHVPKHFLPEELHTEQARAYQAYMAAGVADCVRAAYATVPALTRDVLLVLTGDEVLATNAARDTGKGLEDVATIMATGAAPISPSDTPAR